MRNKEIKVSVPGPRLPVVLGELVERICADDWHRLSTEGGGRFYYIVGEHAAQLPDNSLDFTMSEFPGARPTANAKGAGPVAEHVVRSQVAAKHPNYLQRARKRLEKAGVATSLIDSFLAGEQNLAEWPIADLQPEVNDEGYGYGNSYSNEMHAVGFSRFLPEWKGKP